MTWNLSDLKPGDEVGIEVRRKNRVSGEAGIFQAVGIVAEVTDDGCIGLEGDEWCNPSGEYLMEGWGDRRLCPPTDEGRLATLQETIHEDLCDLQRKARLLPLSRLKELRETVLGLLADGDDVVPRRITSEDLK